MNEKEYLNHVIRPSQQRANAGKKKLAEIEYLEQLKRQEDHAMTVALGSRSSSRLSAKRLHEGKAGIQNAEMRATRENRTMNGVILHCNLGRIFMKLWWLIKAAPGRFPREVHSTFG